MGDWTITVHGTGAHHNDDYPQDADKMAEHFVVGLRKAGHTIHSASFTHGARQKLGTSYTAPTSLPAAMDTGGSDA